MSRRFAALVLLAVSVAAGAAAAGPSAEAHFDKVPAKDHARTNPMANKLQAAEGGAALYKDHCAQCHGPSAEGDGAKKPSLRTDSVRSATDGDLEWFLRQGDIAHGMPSWSSLPQAQRWQIITYLRSLQNQAQ